MQKCRSSLIIRIRSACQNRTSARFALSCLRLNTGFTETVSAGTSGMRKDHFGMDMDNLGIAIDKLNALGIPVEGIHLFKVPIASTAPPFLQWKPFRRCCHHRGTPWLSVEKVNLGGGLSAHWDQEGFDFAQYRARLAPLQERYEVLHESGRAVLQHQAISSQRS